MEFWSEVTFTVVDDDYGSEIIFCLGPATQEEELTQFLDRLQVAAEKRRIKSIAVRRGPPEAGELLNTERITKAVEAILDEIQELHSWTSTAIDF